MPINHLLANKVVIYEKNEVENPEDCVYDLKRGTWLWGKNKEVLVKSNNPNCPKRGTKKKDIETGEDLKGE